MGTFLTDKCAEIRKWLAVGPDVYPDEVVTSWIRMAEEYLSTGLRVKHMIQIDTSVIANGRVALPLDWQEIRLVRTLPDGGVLRYQTPDAFYNPEFTDPPTSPYDTRHRRYCILGNYLIIGDGAVSPSMQVEMVYYQDIPPLTNDANNWINSYNPTVYTLKILHIASVYVEEDERGMVWDREVTRLVNAMNVQHQIDKASGSVLVQTRKKTFG